MSNDPIPRCEPPEHEDQMWHWLKRGEIQKPVMWWDGRKSWLWPNEELTDPEETAECGWRYVCVCPEPEMESEINYVTMRGET